ncbi:MAG: B12-binding domain-containing radical SAM protein [Desulfoprunum sp.]
MLLLHPPAAKPGEPPAALAHLAAALRGGNHPCRVCDLNLEAMLHVLGSAPPASDAWSRRAGRNLAANITALQGPDLYHTPARYQRAVRDCNRVLETAGGVQGLHLSFANYHDGALSPAVSDDLIKAARSYRGNIFFPHFSRRLTQLLEDETPPLIGLSLNYLGQALTTFAIIGFLRAQAPAIPIVLGGGLVTTWLRNPSWRNPFTGLVDHLVAGPGEGPLLALLGVEPSCRKEIPDYSGLVDLPYLAPGFILPYAAASGCYWRKCSFCPETSEANPYLPLTPPTVMDELAGLVTAYKPRLLHFLDNAVSPAVLRALIDRPPGVPWYGFARVNDRLADPDYCRELRQAGCVMLKLGIESGSQQVLDGMNKGIDVRQVSKALEALAGAGIATYVYLLFGTPGESIEEARETLAFVAGHHQLITFLNLAIFNLPVGSGEVSELEITTRHQGDLTLYHDFRHPRGWGRREIRRFLDREFKRRPAIRAILQRDPPFFTSNHAAFFVGPNGGPRI